MTPLPPSHRALQLRSTSALETRLSTAYPPGVQELLGWTHGGPLGVRWLLDAVVPLTLFVLHPIEALGFGGLWIAVLCTHAFSLGGMLLYLAANTLFGMLGHVGGEPLPDGWARWPDARRIGTSTFHTRHHQYRTMNFGFYIAVWDRLFGTLDPAFEETFARLPGPKDARSPNADS